MAVQIIEYNDMALDRGGGFTGLLQEPSINAVRGVAVKNVAITNGSVASAAFEADTHFILIQGDAAFRYMVNRADTSRPAGVASPLVAANTSVILAVLPGGSISICQSDPLGENLAFNDADNSGEALLLLL